MTDRPPREVPDESAPVPGDGPGVERLPDLGYRYVTDDAALAECAAALSRSPVLGVDIEGDSFFSYSENTCLVQVTGAGLPDFIIDPLRIADMTPLGPLFADPSITKVFHGADFDVVSMKRDFGFTFRGIWDTMVAAQATGHERFGLSDLVERYFGDRLEKKYQRHDWSERPLRDEHLEYARLDSHYLPRLREILAAQANLAGRSPMLGEEFALLERREWTGRPFDPDDCLRIKGLGRMPQPNLRALRAMFVLRDGIARSKDRPPFKIWGNDVLIRLARTLPRDRAALVDALGPGSFVARRHGADVLAAIEAGLADETPVPARSPKPPPSRGVPPLLREDESLLDRLKAWRNARATSDKLAPGMIVNNASLRDIAALKPADEADLAAVPDLRLWQRHAFADELIAVVQVWLAEQPQTPADAPPPPRRRRRRRPRGGPPS